MRKFVLYNKDKTLSFDLTKNVVAAEPKGLGNRFSLKYLDTNNGRRLTNVTPEFDPIQLQLYFNVNGQSGYGFYNNLMNFLAAVGFQKFLFEYNDGIAIKLCEVVLQNAPKSEIGEDGIFAEQFSFERQSYWFEELKESLEFKNVSGGYQFPLPFPFRFSGVYSYISHIANNKLAIDAPITIRIIGALQNNINIYLSNQQSGERVAEIQLKVGNQDGYEIHIDPIDKKVTRKTPYGIENAYGLIDHSKQSFLYLPQGQYIISSNLGEDDTGKIELSIRRYLFD